MLNGEIAEMLATVNLKPHEGEVFWGLKTGDFGGEKRAENAAENRHGGPRKRREQTPRSVQKAARGPLRSASHPL